MAAHEPELDAGRVGPSFERPSSELLAFGGERGDVGSYRTAGRRIVVGSRTVPPVVIRELMGDLVVGADAGIGVRIRVGVALHNLEIMVA